MLGYLIYFGSCAFLRTPAAYVAPAPTGRSISGDLADGFRYILGHRGICALLLLMLIGDAMSTAVYQMPPAIAAERLGDGVAGMATLLSAAGLGATFSAFWLAHGGARRVTAPFVLSAFLGFSLAVAALALTRNLAAAAAVMGGFGFAGEARRTGTVSLLQIAVSDAHRGRVMSTQFMLQRLAGGIGAAIVGATADRHGLQGPLLMTAALAVAAWAVAFGKRARIVAAFGGCSLEFWRATEEPDPAPEFKGASPDWDMCFGSII